MGYSISNGYHTATVVKMDGQYRVHVVGPKVDELSGVTFEQPEHARLFADEVIDGYTADGIPATETVVKLDRKTVAQKAEPVNCADLTDEELKVFFAEKLATNSQWVRRGLAAIYKHQTVDEQQEATTKHHNGVGFSGTDAKFLTGLANQMETHSFSQRQLDVLYKVMPKYAGQLVRIVRGKQ